MTDYVELHCRSAFSFLRGASKPEQIADRAAQLQMPAVALCDRDGLYGAPRFYSRAKELGIRPIVGAELTMEDGSVLPVLVQSRTGYENLCRLLTRAHLRNEKGKARSNWNELPEFAGGLVALGTSEILVNKVFPIFGRENLFIEIQRHHIRGEEKNVRALVELSRHLGLPFIATNGVLYSTENERPIIDVFTCIRHHTHLDAAGKLLEQNGERYLKNAAQMRELFRDLPQGIENTVRLAARLDFTLENLGYEFPSFPVPPGHSMDSFLREQAFAGAQKRYGTIPEKVRSQLENELALIAKLNVAGYFLIVWDIVEFCRQNNIMAQGRGSAANSTVCFCLGITAVDPLKFNTLFERFLTEGRKNCWPDIDIDLPSGDRRERVIQEIYRRYGERGAAMTANVITYRGRSAAREVGKALNLSPDIINRFSHLYANGDFPHTLDLQAQMEKSGLPKSHPRAQAFAVLSRAICGLPRHLGQHSGGMIICRGKLDKIVPLENASMPGRVVAQWDKDDCEDLGIIKVDLLGLGMMSVLQDAVALTRRNGREIDLANLPQDDARTFEMMRNADTIGVFQIESRAQMATLPRMKPEIFYDVVVEVAIIRPGPIQGHLMHPYLARRAKKEPIEYYHEDLIPVLKRTLGVPLFQEQMLQMAMVMADFTGSEAEELRRALSFHRSQERMERIIIKLRAAMEQKGHSQKTIDEICETVSAFALYGFPESHAISFAHLAYASAWLKAHRAPEFFTSLLNNQPMGFYSSATLIMDGRRHGVRFRPVCVQTSDWDCKIEVQGEIRLGFRVVNHLSTRGAKRLLEERNKSPFHGVEDFKKRVRLNKDELRTLAEIGALNCFSNHRRHALWEVEKAVYQDDLFERQTPRQDVASPLAPMNYNERIHADFAGMNLTTGRHPMALLRPRLRDVWRAKDLPQVQNGRRVRIAGNVICRQRPGTAKGFVFISLEDETGVSNAVVSPPVFEANRLVITEEAFLLIEGKLQNTENVIHIKAEKITRLEHGTFAGSESYDFH
jgi:error-prone DNA polymerase